MVPGVRDRAQVPYRPGESTRDETDEQAQRKDAIALTETTVIDPRVYDLARHIMEHIALPKPPPLDMRRRGRGNVATMPYRGGTDEIDLDRTLDVLIETPHPNAEDILVRERLHTKRAVVLLVDVSGSMRGERITTAAATVGALASELQHDDIGVIAFWSDAAVVLPLGDPVRPHELLDTMLRIPARGLTNVAFPLEIAAQELARVPQATKRALLLSDCVHNAGPDPRVFAARLPRLDVLLDASGEKDVELGRQLAHRGHGTCRVIHSHRDVAPSITQMLGEE